MDNNITITTTLDVVCRIEREMARTQAALEKRVEIAQQRLEDAIRTAKHHAAELQRVSDAIADYSDPKARKDNNIYAKVS